MDDAAAPAWASALLVTLNEMRVEAQDWFDKLETGLDADEKRIEKLTDQLNQAADDLKAACATLDRITITMINMQVQLAAPERCG